MISDYKQHNKQCLECVGASNVTDNGNGYEPEVTVNCGAKFELNTTPDGTEQNVAYTAYIPVNETLLDGR